MKVSRSILEINEELCNGCGQCILDCAEHALVIVDGKAKVISDVLCDGLGACIQGCPQNALRIIEREALPFDEEAVNTLRKKHGTFCVDHTATQKRELILRMPPKKEEAETTSLCASLRTTPQSTTAPWPLKLRIIPSSSPFLHKANLALIADCGPAVYKDFHTDFGQKIKISCCPKFEDHDSIAQKLIHIFVENPPQSLEVLRMEVPCCSALQKITESVIAFLQENGHVSHLKAKHHVCERDGKLSLHTL